MEAGCANQAMGEREFWRLFLWVNANLPGLTTPTWWGTFNPAFGWRTPMEQLERDPESVREMVYQITSGEEN